MLEEHVIFHFSSINYMFSVNYIFFVNITYTFAIITPAYNTKLIPCKFLKLILLSIF